MRDVEFVDGSGITSQAELDELNKALTVGYTEGTGKTGGDALRVESLEGTLRSLTYDAKHLALWQIISKIPAYSTVEEYNQLISYGAVGNSFLPAGTLPEEDDSSYARQVGFVKYMGTTRKVQHQVTLVRTMIGDVIARENINGTLKLLRDVEDALFWGNRTLAYNYPTVEGYEFDGLNRLIDSDNYLDLAGQDVSEGSIEQAAVIVADNYGSPTDMFISLKAGSAFSQTMLPKGRVIYPSPGGSGGMTAGAVVRDIVTSVGTVTMHPSKFLGSGRSPKVTCPTTFSSAKAPTAPASIAEGSMTGSTGKFHAAQQGLIKFKAVACNRYGNSAPTSASSGVTVTSADLAKYIPLTITNGTVVTAPEWFDIYATEPGGSTYYLVAQVAATSQVTGETTVYNYTGLIMANTSIAFLGELAPEILSFKQLAPLMKMDVAITDPNIKWMILLYGLVQLYASKKWMRIINIK